jgi:hypothetical protein
MLKTLIEYTNHSYFRGKTMLDITCSEVKNGQLVISWQRNKAIGEFIRNQVKDKYLYVLIRIESRNGISSTVTEIEAGSKRLWLEDSGMQNILVFPFWSREKIFSLKDSRLRNQFIFFRNENCGKFQSISRAFDYHQSVVLTEDVDYSNFEYLENPLQYILHAKFSKNASPKGFKKQTWADRVIERAFQRIPKDQCQRKAMTIPAIAVTSFWFILIPLLTWIAATFVTVFLLLFGVSPNWRRFKIGNTESFSISDGLDYNWVAWITPLAFICYGFFGLFLNQLTSSRIQGGQFLIFLASALIGYSVAFYLVRRSKKSNGKEKKISEPNYTANLYLRGEATKSLQTLYFHWYDTVKSYVCKPIDRQ